MNETLTPEQVTRYYKEQTNMATPLSPKEWLKSQTIDASKLAPATPIQLPAQQPDTTNYNAVAQSVPLAPATTEYKTPETTSTVNQDYTNARTNQSSLVGNLTDLYSKITGREAYQAEQETNLGISQQQKDLQELTNQLNSIKAESQAIPLRVQSEFAGRGATAGGVAPIESARNRENAIRALSVGAQLQAVQGNLSLAVEQAKRATDLKYGPLEKEIEMKERQLKLLNDYVLSPLEQERKAQQELALQQQKDALATKKASESDFNENMLIAQQAGMTNLEALEARRLFEAGRIDEANGIIAKYSSTEGQYEKISEGQTLIDPRTGKVIYSSPKTYKPSASDTVSGSMTPENTASQLDFLSTAITNAKNLSGASGQSRAMRTAKEWFVGASDYTNLVAETNTLRTNMLTLMTDPNIKKFFGPQMSNADVQLMTSAGTTLNPELQTPQFLKNELLRYEELINRMKNAVSEGTGIAPSTNTPANTSAATTTTSPWQYLKQNFGGNTGTTSGGIKYTIE